jgi:predicted dehydrogenase
MKLRYGMIGGGPGSFIGAIHRIAAAIDGHTEIVAGAFSSDASRSAITGRELGLNPARVYGTYQEMIAREKELPEDQRIHFVSIVTPNHVHYEPAKLAIENGFHVVLDKPMTFTLEEAKQLHALHSKTDLCFCLTHTYTGYPMVKEARQQVLSGKFGKIRKVYVEYPQGWLSSFLEGSEQKQAAWRTDPGKSGVAGSMGDIGTHAFNLAEYISGLQVTEMCAQVNIVVDGRRLDDDGAVLLRFDNGATGVLMATQVAAGEENNVKIRVFGEAGGIEWKQEEANSLLVRWSDKPTETWRAGTGYLSSYAEHNCRTPAGHPEGYLEAFANLYRNFALHVKSKINQQKPLPEWLDYPGTQEGVRGMQFIERVIESGRSEVKWLKF